MFSTRNLNEDDYNTLVDWWDKSNFPPPPKHKLPLNGLGGIMVFKDDINVCAGFLYLTNSSISWLEFVVANYNYREKDRKDAIRLLIKRLCDIAKDLGFDTVFSVCQSPFLINHFKNEGFTIDSRKSTEVVKLL